MTDAKLDSSHLIKSNLADSKSTGRLAGFTEMGSINDELIYGENLW